MKLSKTKGKEGKIKKTESRYPVGEAINAEEDESPVLFPQKSEKQIS